jgi:MerR family transcriptional regulator, light-induced transcriptional regulator
MSVRQRYSVRPVEAAGGPLRIGELSRRVGVSPDRLRAWERRYGVPRPDRTDGGFRLYSAEEEGRVRRMTELIATGVAPAEAARLAAAPEAPAAPGPATGDLGRLRSELATALDRFEGNRAHAALDRLFAAVGIDAALSEVVFPYLRELGECWMRGEVTVGQEHFASRLIQGRLLGLARGWDSGAGPRAVLACPPGELHDLGLIGHGLALRNRGWRVFYLGADTPCDSLVEAVERLSPGLVALSSVDAGRFAEISDQLAPVASAVPVLMGGAGASERLASRLGATATRSNPVEAADEVERHT